MPANPATSLPTSSRRLLTVLLLVFIFNFVDRQIIGILAVPIKADLGLSDTQLGLMGGLAFALFYTGLGVPIAMLADRKRRVTIIAVCLAIWSAFTALCGLAQNFWQLFLARMGVGVGEAGGLAPCYSLISDTFPPERRGRALAILSLGIPIGSSLGIVLGGWIATVVDWRLAFFVVGLAGLPLVPLVYFGIKEPVRGRFDGGAPALAPVPFGEVLRTVRAKPSFWLIALGSSCGSIVGYGLMFWLPVFFNRSFGLALFDLSLFFGSIVLVGGALGLWLGGSLADHLGKSSVRAYASIPALFAALAGLFYAGAIFAPSLWLAWPLFIAGQVCGMTWYTPVLSALQSLAPPHMRATVSAIYLFIMNLLGIGVGTALFGFLSDRMTGAFGNEALKYSILICLTFYLLGGLIFATARSRIEADWEAPLPPR